MDATEWIAKLDKSLDSSHDDNGVSRGCAKDVAKYLLDLFVQLNFCGPKCSVEHITAAIENNVCIKDCSWRDMLSIDAECVSPLTKYPELLVLAQRAMGLTTTTTLEDNIKFADIDEKNNGVFADTLTNAHKEDCDYDALLLEVRILFAHQKLLIDLNGRLFNMIVSRLNQLFAPDSDSLKTQERIMLLIEASVIFCHYNYFDNALKFLDEAAKLSNFDFFLTGVPGKRTKWQNRDIHQLVLVVDSSNAVNKDTLQSENNVQKFLPNLIELNDDTLLENIEFNLESTKSFTSKITSNLNDIKAPENLSPSSSLILLGIANIIRKSSPKDDTIATEQAQTFINRIITSAASNNYQINLNALYIRCLLESKKSRTAERSLLQLQSIVDETVASIESDVNSKHSFLPSVEDVAPAHVRMQYAYQLDLNSVISLKKDLAGAYLSMGMVKSAMDIFLELNMIHEHAMCLVTIGQKDQAIINLKRELERDDQNYHVWLTLGQIENSLEKMQVAWEKSKHKYSKAQKSIAEYWMNRSNFENAIEAYTLCLKINPLQFDAWYNMGCAALAISDFKTAKNSFSRCVCIEPEHGESWSNLATSFLNLFGGDENSPNIKLALTSLRQAAKYNPTKYKIWENYAIVSTKAGSQHDIIACANALFELKVDKLGESAIDIELFKAVLSLYPVQQPMSNNFQTRQIDTLISNIAKKIVERYDIFSILAKFFGSQPNHIERAAEYYTNYYRSLNNRFPSMSGDDAVACKEMCRFLSEYIDFASQLDSEKHAKIIKASKSLLRLVVRRLENIDWELDSDLKCKLERYGPF